jgi:hypothetical protein
MGALPPPRPPLRIGPAEDCARGPVGTFGRSGILCLISGRSRVRLIWSTTLDGCGYGAAAERADVGAPRRFRREELVPDGDSARGASSIG